VHEYVIVWEFRIKPEVEAEFMEQYGPVGIWARLFKQSQGYLKTELLRDVTDDRRFLTLDYWKSEEEFNKFRRQHSAEYERLDKELQG
jgi:heme-degrading monooxygenase HmoA